MEYQILVAKGAEVYDVSEFAGAITWSDTIDTLGMQLDFTLAAADERYFPKFPVEPGDIVILYGKSEIFRGIIVTKNFDGPLEQSFTAFDFCFYLNKSRIIKQFNGVNATDAIKQVCAAVGIEVGGIAAMRASIQHIYFNSTVAEIIEDILIQEGQETGKQYIKEMQGALFTIFEKTSKPITAQFKPASNIASFDITLAAGGPTKSLSIEEMKNAVLIITGDEQSARVLAEAKDKEAIAKYGLLQEVESVDEKDFNKVQNIASNRLQELDRVAESVNISLLGADEVRAGRVLTLEVGRMAIQGAYFIKSCIHTVSAGIHTMELELERVQ